MSSQSDDGNTKEFESIGPKASEKVVTEGLASIIVPKEGAQVFYNPVQVVNRDLSILVIRAFSEIRDAERQEKLLAGKRDPNPDSQFKILEALSASGLRSIRYAQEIPGVTEITANDMDQQAMKAIKRNAEFSGTSSDVLKVNCAEASIMMHMSASNGKSWDVIDLDPYGTASPFLDSAVQAVSNGGLLCVTCTDMANLCGNNSSSCFAKYGVMPLHTVNCHEGALRVLLSCIEMNANKYKRHIVPLLSVSIDFYVRVFVRVFVSASEAKWSASKKAWAYSCIGCSAYQLTRCGKVHRNPNGTIRSLGPETLKVNPVCEICGRGFHMGGPLWAERIHDPEFVSKIRERTDHKNLSAFNRVEATLTAVSSELEDVPLYYTLPKLCSILHCTSPPITTFRSAVINAGYRISRSHANAQAIKTDMPISNIWDILVTWAKKNPTKRITDPNPNSPAFPILNRVPSFEVDFTIADGSDDRVDGKRFLPNPQEEWGPGRLPGKQSKKEKGKAEKQSNKRELTPDLSSSNHKNGSPSNSISKEKRRRLIPNTQQNESSDAPHQS